jgi:hypothetical protein
LALAWVRDGGCLRLARRSRALLLGLGVAVEEVVACVFVFEGPACGACVFVFAVMRRALGAFPFFDAAFPVFAFARGGVVAVLCVAVFVLFDGAVRVGVGVALAVTFCFVAGVGVACGVVLLLFSVAAGAVAVVVVAVVLPRREASRRAASNSPS